MKLPRWIAVPPLSYPKVLTAKAMVDAKESLYSLIFTYDLITASSNSSLRYLSDNNFHFLESDYLKRNAAFLFSQANTICENRRALIACVEEKQHGLTWVSMMNSSSRKNATFSAL